MSGREPAAFNFIDLTQSGDNDVEGGSTSAAPAATMPLLRPKAPMVEPNDGTSLHAATGYMQPPPAWGQAHMLGHPGSTSTANNNHRGNNGVYFHRPDQSYGISDDHCRAYLDQQGGGKSAARQRRRLEPRPIQPAPDHNAVNNIAKHPTDRDHNAVNNIAKHPTDRDQVKPDQTQTLGNNLTLASAYHQAAAEFDRNKRAQKEEASRQKHLMMINEANQQQAILFQQRQAAMFLAAQTARMHGHNAHMYPQHAAPAPNPHPGRPLLPRPPLMNYPMINTNNMMQGSATVIPGSMNWMAQQRQQHFSGLAPNLMSCHGSRLAIHHSGITAQMTIFYASMVNVYDNVSFELAQAVCMMLAGKESKFWPPRTQHYGSGPPPEPTLASQPAPMSPQMSAPSATQAGPSQAPTQAGPSQAATQAGPSQAAPTGKLPQARKASLTRFLEKRKERIHSKDNEEEDEVALISPHEKSVPIINTLVSDQPSCSGKWHDQKPTVTSPSTPPATASSNLKRKLANSDSDLYVRGRSGEYAAVEDVKPSVSTTDYVMREYQAILKEFNQ